MPSRPAPRHRRDVVMQCGSFHSSYMSSCLKPPSHQPPYSQTFTVLHVMTSTRLIVVFSAVPLYAVWRLVRMMLARSPLDNIPGPPPTSRLTGELVVPLCNVVYLTFLVGNMDDFMSFDNVAFNRKLVETYGSVCRLTSFLGVRMQLSFCFSRLTSIVVVDEGAAFT